MNKSIGYTSGPITTTDYFAGFQYFGGILQFFPHAEGYVKVTDNRYNYVFNYTDHLGNVRLSYGADANNVLKILEENNYYPFGMRHRNYNMSQRYYYKTGGGNINIGTVLAHQNLKYDYKFGGKELQDELSLNLYDFGSRNYDATIGRWNVIDPQAEKYYDKSAYNYALNNPMYFVDPNGEDIYLHYFLRNNHHDGKKEPNADKMFMAAAMTRAMDFLNSGEGGSDDIMIMKGIDSMDDLESNIESDVA